MRKFGIEWNSRRGTHPGMFEKDELLQSVTAHGLVIIRGQSFDAQGLRDLGRLLGPPVRPIALTSPPPWVVESLSDDQRGYRASIRSASLAKGENEWCLLLRDVQITKSEKDSISIPELCMGSKSGIIGSYDELNQIDIIESVGVDDLQRTDFWHSDASYFERPPSLGIFYASVVPEDGSGETLFCDMTSALESLSPKLRDLLSQCCAIHAADAHVRRHGEHRGRLLAIPAIPSPVEHPIVRSIGDNNPSCLYINPFYTERIVGLEYKESDALLDMIFAKCTRPEFTFCHRWRVGDVVIWDNRTTMHYSVRNVTKGHYRKLMRVLIDGERPAGD